ASAPKHRAARCHDPAVFTADNPLGGPPGQASRIVGVDLGHVVGTPNPLAGLRPLLDELLVAKRAKRFLVAQQCRKVSVDDLAVGRGRHQRDVRFKIATPSCARPPGSPAYGATPAESAA